MTGKTLKLTIALIGVVVVAAGGALAFGAFGGDGGAQAAEPRGAPAAAGEPAGRDDDDGGEADEQPASRQEADLAGAAALKIAGGGTVTEVERADDPGEAYEVEILKDGTEVDVTLDRDLRPVPEGRDDE